MARYNRIQLGATYLTSNGLVGGIPCKVNVEGLGQLLFDKTGQIIQSANGTPYSQTIDVDKHGLVLTLTLDYVAQAVFNTLVAAINTAINAGNSIVLDILGDTGNYVLNVIPLIPDPVTHEGFSGAIIKQMVIKVMTV